MRFSNISVAFASEIALKSHPFVAHLSIAFWTRYSWNLKGSQVKISVVSTVIVYVFVDTLL